MITDHLQETPIYYNKVVKQYLKCMFEEGDKFLLLEIQRVQIQNPGSSFVIILQEYIFI